MEKEQKDISYLELIRKIDKNGNIENEMLQLF